MKIEDQVKQLTELMADLVPTVDRLVHQQENLTNVVEQLVGSQNKTNMALSEMRTSNMKLADAIERLIVKIDKIDQFEERLTRLEKVVLK